MKPILLKFVILVFLSLMVNAQEADKSASIDQLKLQVVKVTNEVDNRERYPTTRGSGGRALVRRQTLHYNLRNLSDAPARGIKLKIIWVSEVRHSKHRTIVAQTTHEHSLEPGESVSGVFEAKADRSNYQQGKSPSTGSGTRYQGYNIRVIYEGKDQTVAFSPKSLEHARENPKHPTHILGEETPYTLTYPQ